MVLSVMSGSRLKTNCIDRKVKKKDSKKKKSIFFFRAFCYEIKLPPADICDGMPTTLHFFPMLTINLLRYHTLFVLFHNF